MTISQITPEVYIQELDLGIFDLRGSLLLGNDTALIWDTLSHPRDMTAWLPLIKNRTLWVAYSHADWDHIWGSAGLDQPALIIGHTECDRRFNTEAAASLADKQAAEPGRWDDVSLIAPNLIFSDELELELGGLRVQLQHLPGHTPDSLVALLPDHGIALMADTIEHPLPVVPADSPLPQWIDRLTRIADDSRYHKVIPCHGQTGGRELIANTIDYLQKIYAGEHIELPANLSPFYRDTHASNLRWQRPD